MATLKDLSAYLGLSVTQVSRALNGHSDVSEATRERVQEAALALNYQPNLSARKLARGRSGMIALVRRFFPEITKDGMFLDVITGLSLEFAKREMLLVLNVSPRDEDPVDVHQRLYAGGTIDGFVLLEPFVNDPRVKYLQEQGVPFVVHGRTEDAPDYAFFDIDNIGVGYELTKHLIKLGHERILLLNSFADRGYSYHREKGYRKALEEAGIAFDANLVENSRMFQKFGYDAVEKHFANNNPPTAIICGHLRIADGVYEALKARGLRIPDDVSVVSHDDLLPDYKIEDFEPPLTVCRAAIQDSWVPLTAFLDRAVAGEDPKNLQEIEPIELIVHASTAKANTRN